MLNKTILSLDFSKYQVHVNHYWLFLWNRIAYVGFQENVACSVSIEYITVILSVMDPGLCSFPFDDLPGTLVPTSKAIPICTMLSPVSIGHIPWGRFSVSHLCVCIACDSFCWGWRGPQCLLASFTVYHVLASVQQWPLPGIEAHHRAFLRASPLGSSSLRASDLLFAQVDYFSIFFVQSVITGSYPEIKISEETCKRCYYTNDRRDL